MKTVMISAMLLGASLVFTSVSQADHSCRGGIYSGLPYYGFGYSGSLYGLGYVPVPPYYALHPPVYYNHEILRRPLGDSPYAYSARRPAPVPKRQFSLNPFVPDSSIKDGSQQASQAADSVARVMRNPFYGDGQQLASASPRIDNPYAAQPEAIVAQSGD